jgi:hypothetical protein
MIFFLVGVRYYPQPDMKHNQSLYLACCQLLKDYIYYGLPIPITKSYYILYILSFLLYHKFVTLFLFIQGPHTFLVLA